MIILYKLINTNNYETLTNNNNKQQTMKQIIQIIPGGNRVSIKNFCINPSYDR